jgi:hypothetical protein
MRTLFVLVTLCLSWTLVAQEMLPMRYDAREGKLLLEVRELDTDMIYTNTLATGVGTVSPLLDRGQLGDDALVRFERHGSRVLLVRQNAGHRALTGNAALARSVEESFPRSVLASFEIVSERRGVPTVDATDFFLSDVFDVIGSIRAAGLGNVRLDAGRSFVDAEYTRSFPQNTEVRAVLSYAADAPPILAGMVTPGVYDVTAIDAGRRNAG